MLFAATPRAERLEPPAVPVRRADRRARRARGEGAHRRGARARRGGRSATATATTVARAPTTTSRKARMAAHDAALRRRVRACPGADPAVPRPLPRARADRGRVGVPRVPEPPARGACARATAACSRSGTRSSRPSCTSCSHIPDDVFIAATITLGRPAGATRPGAAPAAAGAGVRRAVGRARAVGRRSARHEVHRGRPAGPTGSRPVQPAGKEHDMTWDFSTEPEFQEKLDWIREFVQTEIEPIDLAFGHDARVRQDRTRCTARSLPPLQEQVKAQGLWACHLGPDLGGLGYGQVKLALDQRDPRPVELGAERRSAARRPTPATPRSSPTTARRSRRTKYLQPLLDGKIVSLLLDDRAAGRRRPRRVHVPGRAGRRRVGHQRREVVLVEPELRRVRDRDGASPTPTCRSTRARR